MFAIALCATSCTAITNPGRVTFVATDGAMRRDAGPRRDGGPDAGRIDAGLRDAEVGDAGEIDAEVGDAGAIDAEVGDAGPVTCGNGVLDTGEACDDGNLGGGDGCDDCAIEAGFDCIGAPSRCVACANLSARIRDFSPTTHPDFQTFIGTAAFTGMLEPMLDGAHRPVFAAPTGAPVTSAASFAQWYVDIPPVNMSFYVELPVISTGGLTVFDARAFFPADGRGFGYEGYTDDTGGLRNFHFTTEINHTFNYHGGETLTFRGDDDAWVFIEDRLVIDLGGVHTELTGSVDLDTLAWITPGNTYRMSIFHAERYTSHSHFRIESTIRCFLPE